MRPLPYQRPEALAKLWEHPPGYAHNSVAPLNFMGWSEQTTVFASMAAVCGGSRTLHTAEGGAEVFPASRLRCPTVKYVPRHSLRSPAPRILEAMLLATQLPPSSPLSRLAPREHYGA
jgi:hypothetical protein